MNDPLRDQYRYYERVAEIHNRKDDYVKYWETGGKVVRWVGDKGADHIGNIPGAGKFFRWGYYGVTRGISNSIETGSVTKGVWHKSTASRKVSRLSARVKAMAA